MFTYLKQAKVRLKKRWNLHRRSFRRNLREILAQYPAQEIKTEREIIADLRFLIQNRSFGRVSSELFYYLRAGMHLKGADITNYISWLQWSNDLGKLYERAKDEAAILDDKQKQIDFLSSHGFRIPVSFGKLYPGSAATTLPPLLDEHGEIFCKPPNLYGGKGCMKLRKADSPEGCLVNGQFMSWEQLEHALTHIDADMQPEYFLLMESIQQHEALAAIHPSSINTLRLLTMREQDGHIFYLQGLIRVGSGGANVDNATAGGFFIGINEDGTLKDRAHCWRHDAPVPLFRHPDTGVVFKGLQIPYFEEAKKMICAAHAAFSPHILMPAWDIAITPTGPLIVEVNDFGCTAIMQRAHGGWLPIYRKYVEPLLKDSH